MILKKIGLIIFLSVWGAFFGYGQEITISGVVTSESDNMPLPLANVLVKGKSIGTTTDFDGKYSLRVPSINDVLIFRYQGFKTQEIIIGNQTAINISLKMTPLYLMKL